MQCWWHRSAVLPSPQCGRARLRSAVPEPSQCEPRCAMPPASKSRANPVAPPAACSKKGESDVTQASKARESLITACFRPQCIRPVRKASEHWMCLSALQLRGRLNQIYTIDLAEASLLSVCAMEDGGSAGFLEGHLQARNGSRHLNAMRGLALRPRSRTASTALRSARPHTPQCVVFSQCGP